MGDGVLIPSTRTAESATIQLYLGADYHLTRACTTTWHAATKTARGHADNSDESFVRDVHLIPWRMADMARLGLFEAVSLLEEDR